MPQNIEEPRKKLVKSEGAKIKIGLSGTSAVTDHGTVTQSSSQLADPGEFRVFISSTFNDMQAEREYLVKQVFPELRQLCRERGVTFTEIDLRWGITERQARRRKIVSTCLDEIHRHTPYIIAIIGERYGWQPGHDDLGNDPAVHDRYPWLRSGVETKLSLVELETVESALYNAMLRERTRFYFRGSTNGQSPHSDESSVLALKERIRTSGLAVREPYSDVETLGRWVREDLLAVIDRLYPPNRSPSFAERERRGHESFAASRRRVYVEHPATLRKLDEFVASAWSAPSGGVSRSQTPAEMPRPLVITGESGSGKSALLSYWSERYRREHPEAFIITHHIGATSTSTGHLGLLRRVMLEIQERYGVTQEVPSSPEKIESEFRYWLGYASREGLVLVIDALNQLDESSLRSLQWLPDYFPPYVRVIVSTLEGEILDELQRRQWQVVKVKALNKAEREKVVRGYFRSFGKTLDTRNVRRLVSDTKSISPLYLVTTMEELRIFGTYEELSRRIEHYLEAEDLDDLFQRVLARLEADYGKKLVREVMSLIWASRNGLSERELLELTRSRPSELTRLLHALDFHLLKREGVLGFFHDYLRRSVEKRYLVRAARKRSIYERLTEYFEREPVTVRTTQELLHVLEKVGDRERLELVLTEIGRFEKLWVVERHEVMKQWSAADLATVVEAYGRELERWKQLEMPQLKRQADVLRAVADLFEGVGAWHDAERIVRERVELLREVEDRLDESRALAELGGLVRKLGRMEEAIQLACEAEQIARELRDQASVALAIGNRGVVHSNRGEYAQALACCIEWEKIVRQLGDRLSIANALGSRGIIHARQGEYEKALTCYQEQGEIARELGDHRVIGYAISNRGIVHYFRSEYAEAIECYQEQEEIARELGDREGLARAVGNRGHAHTDRGEYAQALECFHRAYSVHNTINFLFGCTHWLEGSVRVLLKLVKEERQMPAYLPAHIPGVIPRTWRSMSLRTARKHAVQCVAISRELSKPDTLFTSQILLVEIELAEGNNEAAYSMVLAMLDDATNEVEQAELHYWLWKLSIPPVTNGKPGVRSTARAVQTGNASSASSPQKGREENRLKALRLYEQIAMKIPRFDYKERIEELKSAVDERSPEEIDA
jgi:tetratricopeptide (TPR) repeat protein